MDTYNYPYNPNEYINAPANQNYYPDEWTIERISFGFLDAAEGPFLDLLFIGGDERSLENICFALDQIPEGHVETFKLGAADDPFAEEIDLIWYDFAIDSEYTVDSCILSLAYAADNSEMPFTGWLSRPEPPS